MSRFLTRIARLAPFEKAGLGVAEWSALSVIANKSGINNRQLVGLLGVSAQRVNQITDSLKSAGYISLAVAPDDARKKVISVTPTGTARLNELNSKLLPIIEAAIQKRPQILTRANRMINITLMRIVARPKK
jgi:DNA-binding MarR family transcriptional regulator